jgi:hypothetical protein
MKPQKRKTPLAFMIALFNIFLGSIGLGASLLIPTVPKGIGELAIGCLLLGAGEYLNNPRFSQQPAISNFLMRRRNVCALGNLLDIAGILMIFVGVSSILL